MNRMFLIKNNAKHSIPQSSPFYVPSLTTLPHLQKLTHRLDCHLLFPHLTSWVWKHRTHTAQLSVVQQNQWPVKMLTQAVETLWLGELDLPFPPKCVQSYAKFQHWAATAQHCPTLTTAPNVMLEQSIERENLIWCFSFFSVVFCFAKKKKKKQNAWLQFLLWTTIN